MILTVHGVHDCTLHAVPLTCVCVCVLPVRTDYHPAKGFVMTRDVGLELLQHWAVTNKNINWQHLLRSDAVRQGRQCVIPETPCVHPLGWEQTMAAGDSESDDGDVEEDGVEDDSESDVDWIDLVSKSGTEQSCQKYSYQPSLH